MKDLIRSRRHALAAMLERFEGLSPLKRLNQGFSYVENEERRNISSIRGVHAGEQLRITVSDGTIDTVVREVRERKA